MIGSSSRWVNPIPAQYGISLLGQLLPTPRGPALGGWQPGRRMHLVGWRLVHPPCSVPLPAAASKRPVRPTERRCPPPRWTPCRRRQLRGIAPTDPPSAADGAPIRPQHVDIYTSPQAATSGHEHFPNPGRRLPPHRMPPRVPVVEIPHHRDPAGIRRPHREPHPGHALHGRRVGPQRLVQIEVPARADQIEVERAERRPEPVGILRLIRDPMRLDAQAVWPGGGQGSRPQPVLVDPVQRPELGTPGIDQHDGVRTGDQGADGKLPLLLMRPQHGERVAMPPMRQGLQRARLDRHAVSPSRRSAIAWKPPSGIGNQAGRFATSYRIS